MKTSKDRFIAICVGTFALVLILKTESRPDLSELMIYLNLHKYLAVLEEIPEAEKLCLHDCDVRSIFR